MTFLDLTGLTRFLDKVKAFVGGLISTHNTASDAHSDIRTNVSGLQSEATAKWELLNTVDNRSNTTASGLEAHLTDDNNPHNVTAGQVLFVDGDSFQDKLDAGELTGATGATGTTGATGATGADGKSAFASAVSGGYTSTESQFYSDLAAIQNLASTILSITGGA